LTAKELEQDPVQDTEPLGEQVAVTVVVQQAGQKVVTPLAVQDPR
jgi:hypothetical protein